MSQIKHRAVVAAALVATFGGGIAAQRAYAAQPQMEAALSALFTAREQLNASLPDKGGHRVNAIAAVNTAITETQAGIAFAGN